MFAAFIRVSREVRKGGGRMNGRVIVLDGLSPS